VNQGGFSFRTCKKIGNSASMLKQGFCKKSWKVNQKEANDPDVSMARLTDCSEMEWIFVMSGR
jgi:hypothetical protein